MTPTSTTSLGLGLTFLSILFNLASASEGHDDNDIIEEDEHGEPALAVLFPWFSQVLGVVVFFLMTRYIHMLPYTAIMFILGGLMGAGAVWRGEKTDELKESIVMWADIDGEVLLLVFLPGLLFRDAFSVNFHLFHESFSQLIIMAFPMVLAGTALTALIGYYIFPYDWTFNLSMTFGSILAATDPVAVSALLNEVGAPPRLKMHVSGESMLNDGSAVVFYSIFSALFLYELNIDAGDDINWGEGFAKFFRMSLGGAAIGIAFAFGLMVLLFLLNRRLEREENVLQVAATVTVAYLSFYVAEVPCKCSGVISVVTCGITTQAFGSNMINDQHLMDSFWILTEHLLNTLLFALGGVVWGAVLADDQVREGRQGLFDAQDWGYLILLYILLTALRFFLVFAFYPILSRIGMKTNWRECVFLSYGGLRGAVGIALALSLNNEVFVATEVKNKNFESRDFTTKLFGMVGGIACLTLVINGTTAGPLLKKLDLIKSTEMRKKLVEQHREKAKFHILDDFLHLMTEQRFHKVDYSVVLHHVHILKEVTTGDLLHAVRMNREAVPASQYKKPNLDNVLPYLSKHSEGPSKRRLSVAAEFEKAMGVELANDEEKQEHATTLSIATVAKIAVNYRRRLSTVDFVRTMELRTIFIDLLRSAYKQQVEKGELEGRGFLDYSLFQSLEFAADEVRQGKPLNDWEASHRAGGVWCGRVEAIIAITYGLDCKRGKGARAVTSDYIQLRLDVKRALAFIAAHETAQSQFKKDFADEDILGPAERRVISESEAEVQKAKSLMSSYDHRDVEVVVSHFLCIILLNKAARYMEHNARVGVLHDREVQHVLEQIEEELNDLKYCSRSLHPGELSKEEKMEKMLCPSFGGSARHLVCNTSDVEESEGSSENNNNANKEDTFVLNK